MNISDFKKSLSKLDEIIYFDLNNFLREKTSDTSKLQQYILIAENLFKYSSDMDERYFLMGTLGNLYRIYGDPQKAVDLLTICIKIAAAEENINREIVSSIRLGEAFKYKNCHLIALVNFEKALKLCEIRETIYQDFALQHKGKCLLELGKFIEAEKCFKEALKLREYKGDRKLIESTQLAINLLEKLKI